MGAILGGRVVTKRGDHVSVAPPARRGDLHALTAVGQQLLAVMESDTAVVRVKPRRPTAALAKYATPMADAVRANGRLRTDGPLPFTVVGRRWALRVALSLGAPYRIYERPNVVGAPLVAGAYTTWTPELSGARWINCLGVRIHFGPRGDADLVAASLMYTEKSELSVVARLRLPAWFKPGALRAPDRVRLRLAILGVFCGDKLTETDVSSVTARRCVAEVEFADGVSGDDVAAAVERANAKVAKGRLRLRVGSTVVPIDSPVVYADEVVQYRRDGAIVLHSMARCFPLQRAIDCVHAIVGNAAQSLGHLPLAVHLSGWAEGCEVVVSTALAPFAAGRSGDGLRLLDPLDRHVGTARGWSQWPVPLVPLKYVLPTTDRVPLGLNLEELVDMPPGTFRLRSIYGSPLKVVAAETVDAWMHGLTPPTICLVTPRWDMLEAAQALAARFDRRARDGFHRRLDDAKEALVFAFLELSVLRARVAAVRRRADANLAAALS